MNWERADSNLDQSWNLSLVGDWDSFTENTNVQNRTHGPTHEMLTVASETVQHDVKGNMTLIPAVLRPGSDPLALTWDFDNRLVSADVDDDSVADVTYQWDALGRRVGRDDGTTATVYVQNGQQTFADYTAGTVAGSPTYNYVFASYIDEPVVRDGSGGLRYYHRNQQYSVTALTNGSGTITERYAYTAYGQPTFFDGSGTVISASAENNRYTYTGREWDEELHLYHYRARMYDAVSGRFLGRDPIGYGGGTPNLFEYVGSQPTKWLDAMGLEWNLGRKPPPGMGSPPGRGSLPPPPKPVNKPPRTSGSNRVRVRNGVTECRTNTSNGGPPGPVNGCGAQGGIFDPPDHFGNFSFHGACNAHDACYGTCGISKSSCDNAFWNDMVAECDANTNGWEWLQCRNAANLYYTGVHLRGNGAYQSGQDSSCAWIPCSKSCLTNTHPDHPKRSAPDYSDGPPDSIRRR